MDSISDDLDIAKNNTRGIYIGNYFKWDPNKHVELVKKIWLEARLKTI